VGADASLPSHPYPADESSPFFWRTGAAFADFTGNGLTDIITMSNGEVHGDVVERHATLFGQFPRADGGRELRSLGPLRLTDGRLINDSTVGRAKHWTESMRAVDWDGNGKIDLVYNLAGTGEIYLLRNVGVEDGLPVFAPPRQFCCYGRPIAFTVHGPNCWPGDVNGDGHPDLMGCTEWSVYPIYSHAALEMASHPTYTIEECY
jgi:hypothetical protein